MIRDRFRNFPKMSVEFHPCRAFEDDVFELDREKFDGERREEIERVDVGGHSDDDEVDDECGYPSQVARLPDFLSIM